MTKRKIPLRSSIDNSLGSSAVIMGAIGSFVPAILSPAEDFAAAVQGSVIASGIILGGGYALLGAANLASKGLNYIKDSEEAKNREILSNYRAQQENSQNLLPVHEAPKRKLNNPFLY